VLGAVDGRWREANGRLASIEPGNVANAPNTPSPPISTKPTQSVYIVSFFIIFYSFCTLGHQVCGFPEMDVRAPIRVTKRGTWTCYVPCYGYFGLEDRREGKVCGMYEASKLNRYSVISNMMKTSTQINLLSKTRTRLAALHLQYTLCLYFLFFHFPFLSWS